MDTFTIITTVLLAVFVVVGLVDIVWTLCAIRRAMRRDRQRGRR
jgi:hypothetical protein